MTLVRLIREYPDVIVGENEDVADPGDDAEPGAEGSKKRTKTHRPEATLAKSAAQLRTKKLELEFTVDPLFKKTCADFDESGAQGLLMNHLALGLGGSLRVVFDAGDSAGAGADEEGEDEPEEPQDLIDLSYLRSEHMNDPIVYAMTLTCIKFTEEYIPSLDALDDKAISHSLEGFSFQKGAFTFDDITFLNTTTLENDIQDCDSEAGDVGGNNTDLPMDVDGGLVGGEPVQDFFVGDQAVQDDYGEDFAAHDPGIDSGGDAYGVTQGSSSEPGPKANGVFEPFDPRRMPNERDLVMAMTDADGEGGMMDYFDQNFLKNWAGPEHWKLRKAIRKGKR